MNIPKRIRLIKACRSHLYNEVKTTLATDKEVKALRYLDSRVQKFYIKQTQQR